MNAIVKSPFAWLLKREYWEERRGFLWAQVIVAGVIIVLSILGIIVAEATRARWSDHIRISDSGNLSGALQNALSHNMDGLVHALDATMLMFGMFAAIVLFFVTFFYLLGALYDDRRDRSILFWKSLPLSDTSTVISKVVSAVILAPLIAVVVVLAGYIVQQIVMSIWFAAHGLNPFPLLWAHTGPFSTWLHMLAMIPVDAVWALPTVGWLLLWSAVVRSKPFLWAVAVPIIVGVLNFWIQLLGMPHVNLRFMWGDLVGRSLLSVFPGSWMAVYANTPDIVRLADMNDVNRHVGTYGMMYHVFATPEMWIGAVVGIALIAASVWFRRWRDET
ncbi:MAG TPA: ABC-2 transporter permease [Rhodanobacteraceae bacterium]|nr:ABC-2 transporter permease [Rhodanobacteraceae bacterium]